MANREVVGTLLKLENRDWERLEGQWEVVEEDLFPVAHAPAVVINGQLAVFGGRMNDGSITTRHWRYDLRSQRLAISDYSKLRACIAWAWHSFFWVLRNAGSELDDSEVRKIEECGLFMFHGWNEAAALAIANNEPHWQMIPKLHLMWHCWRHAVQTRRNLTRQWAFMDEDAMQKISRVAM